MHDAYYHSLMNISTYGNIIIKNILKNFFWNIFIFLKKNRRDHSYNFEYFEEKDKNEF